MTEGYSDILSSSNLITINQGRTAAETTGEYKKGMVVLETEISHPEKFPF